MADIYLLPDGGKTERAIMDPLEAEALYASKVVAPYGKSFESWVLSEDFSKEKQFLAGGFKIWSDSGEFLPRGEVIYRWPADNLPESGMLEIFSDDHVGIELMHEGRHISAGVGSLVVDLGALPAFYDFLILRFSSDKAHRALVWAQHYQEYEQVQSGEGSFKELKSEWNTADSIFFMNLKGLKPVWVKRIYKCANAAKKWRLNFSQDIDEFYLNGVKVPYPQVLDVGVLKDGENEVIFKSSSWDAVCIC